MLPKLHFSNLKIIFRLASRLALRLMARFMLSFATHLDLNVVAYAGARKPYWPQYQAAGSSNFNMVDVNCTQIDVVGDFDVSAQCDFWHGMSCIVRN